jgi:hypothetical protein
MARLFVNSAAERIYSGLFSVFFTFKKAVGNPSKLAFAVFRTCRFGEGETNAVKEASK